jgi:hypothetical protein
MQCPGNNKDNIINHVPIPVENIIPLGQAKLCPVIESDMLACAKETETRGIIASLTLCTVGM